MLVVGRVTESAPWPHPDSIVTTMAKKNKNAAKRFKSILPIERT